MSEFTKDQRDMLVPTTDEVRDIWVDYHLNPLPRERGMALVPEYQEAFDRWLKEISW